MSDLVDIGLRQFLSREANQAFLILLGAIFWVVFSKSRGSAALRAIRFPLRASPPRPVDLAGIPGNNDLFLQEGALHLKELGFRHVSDYELPHLQQSRQRLVFSGFASEDGTIYATLTQRFSNAFAQESYSFTTWCRSGKRLVSSSSVFAGASASPGIHFLLSPESKDPERMVRRHRRTLERWKRRGEEPIAVRTPEDHARQVRDSWDVEIDSLVRRGYQRIEGQEVRPTEKFVRSIFWRGLLPVRRGFSLLYHLLGIGGPAIGLAAVLSVLPGGMLAAAWPLYCLAGSLLGWVTGYLLWQHATFWCLILPALYFRAHPPASSVHHSVFYLIALTTASALFAMQLGFLHNATRAQSRGRRAIAASTPSS